METILITGGMGFIGSHTCVELLEQGYQVIIADNLVNSSPQVLEGIRRITGKQVPFYEVDVADGENLRKVFQSGPIDAVIHFAGLKAVGESKEQPLRYYQNNLNSTMTLLECMAEFQVKRLVFSSSATVYDAAQGPVLTESTPMWCTNPYGWTKFMSEQIIRDFAATQPGFSALLLRYFNPVGAHDSGEIGEAPTGIPNNLMPYIAQVAVGKLPHLNVFGNDYDTPDGTGVRDYIHVSDLAHGHAVALAYGKSHPGAEEFNLGTGHGVSVLEMVETYAQVNQVHIPRVMAPRRPGDVGIYYADTQKANDVLGWKATRTLADMCASSYLWQRKM